MKYNVVLFDADDTLFDFGAAERSAITSVLDSFGLPSSDEVIDEYKRINIEFWKMLERGEIKKEELKIKRFEAFFDHFGFKADAEKMADAYVYELSKQGHLFDGAIDICRRLYGKCRLYIITNGIKTTQEGRFARTPSLMQYFDGVFISESIGHNKPSVEYFEAVANAIPDFDRKKALVVGDSLSSDIAGGINFGIDTCWFNPHGKATPDGMDITYVIDSLDKVYDIVTAQ